MNLKNFNLLNLCRRGVLIPLAKSTRAPPRTFNSPCAPAFKVQDQEVQTSVHERASHDTVKLSMLLLPFTHAHTFKVQDQEVKNSALKEQVKMRKSLSIPRETLKKCLGLVDLQSLNMMVYFDFSLSYFESFKGMYYGFQINTEAFINGCCIDLVFTAFSYLEYQEFGRVKACLLI